MCGSCVVYVNLVVYVWFMCGLCVVYVWLMCGLCVVYVNLRAQVQGLVQGDFSWCKGTLAALRPHWVFPERISPAHWAAAQGKSPDRRRGRKSPRFT